MQAVRNMMTELGEKIRRNAVRWANRQNSFWRCNTSRGRSNTYALHSIGAEDHAFPRSIANHVVVRGTNLYDISCQMVWRRIICVGAEYCLLANRLRRCTIFCALKISSQRQHPTSVAGMVHFSHTIVTIFVCKLCASLPAREGWEGGEPVWNKILNHLDLVSDAHGA